MSQNAVFRAEDVVYVVTTSALVPGPDDDLLGNVVAAQIAHAEQAGRSLTLGAPVSVTAPAVTGARSGVSVSDRALVRIVVGAVAGGIAGAIGVARRRRGRPSPTVQAPVPPYGDPAAWQPATPAAAEPPPYAGVR